MPDDLTIAQEAKYASLIVDPIRVCATYRPKMGQGQGEGLGLSLQDFQRLYRADQFYTWFGLDSPLMYAAHKAAGGMTSIYRQIGIGCEHLFREIIKDHLGLSAGDCNWILRLEQTRNPAHFTLMVR